MKKYTITEKEYSEMVEAMNTLTSENQKLRGFIDGMREQLIIGGVSNTFKAKIQADIDEAKRTLKSTKENTAYSFEDATGWVEEMNLIKGEIQGLNKALNYC